MAIQPARYIERTNPQLYIDIDNSGGCRSYKIKTGNATSVSSLCTYTWDGNTAVVHNNVSVTDPGGSFSRFLPLTLSYSIFNPIGFSCVNSSGTTLFFRKSETLLFTCSKYPNIGQCPNVNPSLLNKGMFSPSPSSDTIMGVDPSTMQWTFTQNGITYGPNIELILYPGIYTFDFSAVAPMHIFGFTGDACGDDDITDGITYNTAGTKMTVTVTPSMKSNRYWYACQRHNCMTSLSPIVFL